jgi:hypothetical protein
MSVGVLNHSRHLINCEGGSTVIREGAEWEATHAVGMLEQAFTLSLFDDCSEFALQVARFHDSCNMPSASAACGRCMVYVKHLMIKVWLPADGGAKGCQGFEHCCD